MYWVKKCDEWMIRTYFEIEYAYELEFSLQ